MHPNRLAVAGFSLIMVLCASISNSAMDVLSARYDSSVFSSLPARSQQWFDPRVSYRNKWKDGDRSHGEAFFLSSTAFVAVTDAWHLFKSLTILFLYAAIIAPFTLIFRLRWYYWVLIYIGVDVLRGTVFELFFTGVLINRAGH